MMSVRHQHGSWHMVDICTCWFALLPSDGKRRKGGQEDRLLLGACPEVAGPQPGCTLGASGLSPQAGADVPPHCLRLAGTLTSRSPSWRLGMVPSSLAATSGLIPFLLDSCPSCARAPSCHPLCPRGCVPAHAFCPQTPLLRRWRPQLQDRSCSSFGPDLCPGLVRLCTAGCLSVLICTRRSWGEPMKGTACVPPSAPKAKLLPLPPSAVTVATLVAVQICGSSVCYPQETASPEHTVTGPQSMSRPSQGLLQDLLAGFSSNTPSARKPLRGFFLTRRRKKGRPGSNSRSVTSRWPL